MFVQIQHYSQELARQLQAEEDAHAQQEYIRRQQLHAERQAQAQAQAQAGRYGRQQNGSRPQNESPGAMIGRPLKMKKEKSCVIM